MADYKEMYLQLFRATEQAINILIHAQKCVEEQYIALADPDLVIIPRQENNEICD